MVVSSLSVSFQHKLNCVQYNIKTDTLIPLSWSESCLFILWYNVCFIDNNIWLSDHLTANISYLINHEWVFNVKNPVVPVSPAWTSIIINRISLVGQSRSQSVPKLQGKYVTWGSGKIWLTFFTMLAKIFGRLTKVKGNPKSYTACYSGKCFEQLRY